MIVPERLLQRLGTAEREALARLLEHLEELLPRVYREALLDYQESRGDDAALFGLRVYKHLRFGLTNLTEEDENIGLEEPNGSYVLVIGPLRIRVDSLGHFVHEDVLGCFPEGSPTKLATGRQNYEQLRFDMPETEPTPQISAFALNRLTVGHFGNPLSGLAKWYVGAWTDTDLGGRSWAWIERQDGAVREQSGPDVPALVPFTERVADVVAVVPRQSA